MATIEDLELFNFSELSDEELLQKIREVRSRRTNPDPEVKEKTVKKAIARQKKGRATALKDVSHLTDGLTQEQAKELFELLTKGDK